MSGQLSDEFRVRDQEPSDVFLVQAKAFTDSDGVTWRRRGGLLEDKALERALLTGHGRVIHEYLADLHDIPREHTRLFWDDAQARMGASAHSSFHGVEFKSGPGARLLIVHEDC